MGKLQIELAIIVMVTAKIVLAQVYFALVVPLQTFFLETSAPHHAAQENMKIQTIEHAKVASLPAQNVVQQLPPAQSVLIINFSFPKPAQLTAAQASMEIQSIGHVSHVLGTVKIAAVEPVTNAQAVFHRIFFY